MGTDTGYPFTHEVVLIPTNLRLYGIFRFSGPKNLSRIEPLLFLTFNPPSLEITMKKLTAIALAIGLAASSVTFAQTTAAKPAPAASATAAAAAAGTTLQLALFALVAAASVSDLASDVAAAASTPTTPGSTGTTGTTSTTGTTGTN